MAQDQLFADEYKVNLDVFEGPLDLLLYLIRREELDIYDIPIELITREYMKFIDEARYCRAFVNDKLRFNRWGRIKIIAALRDKHLPQEHISEAIESIDDEKYIEILKEVIAIKRRELKGKDDFATRQKLIRHAASRGFEPSTIMRLININDNEMDF